MANGTEPYSVQQKGMRMNLEIELPDGQQATVTIEAWADTSRKSAGLAFSGVDRSVARTSLAEGDEIELSFDLSRTEIADLQNLLESAAKELRWNQ